jgi:GNAT superfamily N-acetyltransferase
MGSNVPRDRRRERPVTIEVAGANDVADVLALLDRVFREYGLVFVPSQEVPDLLDFARFYTPPHGAFWMIREDDRLIASVGVERLDATTGELHRLYVDAAARGRGLGQALIDTVCEWCRRHELTRLILWSDTRFTHSHALYERVGFTRTGERAMQDVNQSREYRYEREV